MSIQLATQFSFPADLVTVAASFPTGHYVAADDVAFEANNMGRKIVQTQLVQVHGRDVSVGYVNEDATSYSLVLANENPQDLGSFDGITRVNDALFTALHKVFGGSITSYTHLEMVMAIEYAKSSGVAASDDAGVRKVATWARSAFKRSAWIVKNPMEAVIASPVDWVARGL